RYATLRARHADGANRFFFWFFQAQAAAAVLFTVPALAASVNGDPAFGRLEYAAMILWALAFAGETTADRQLLHFKADPAHKGRTCQVGLWRYSRHPNYFFEWLMWVAYGVFAAESPWGWVALVCPAVMMYLLLRVTGIPATERQAIRTRGDEYVRYQET